MRQPYKAICWTLIYLWRTWWALCACFAFYLLIREEKAIWILPLCLFIGLAALYIPYPDEKDLDR